MIDTTTIVAIAALGVAAIAVATTARVLDFAIATRKQLNQLSAEFWKQSVQQAKENGHQWGFQIRQAEWLRQHIVPLPTATKKISQPPN